MRIVLALFLPLFGCLLPAQRPTVEFQWQKRATALTFGAVPVGQHSLAELPVGQSWRLGNNEASTWSTQMPLLAGDAWIAPGEYRVSLVRSGEAKCELVPDGAFLALGKGPEARVPGDIEKVKKPSKKLEIEWQKTGEPANGNQPARVVVTFGDMQWRGEVQALGNKTVSLAGGKLAVFSIPADRIGKGPVPIATLNKGKKDAWNLILEGAEARFVPCMEAPTESYGFGEIAPPDAARVTTGTVTTLEEKPDKEAPVLELREASAGKGQVRVVVAVGSDLIQIDIAEPKSDR
jgi:hypothetical protein